MGGMVDPQHASIDSLIDWLREQRRRDPRAPLSSLLADKKFDEQRIVDIACIDLMERRRMGHAVSVENYMEDLACIQDETNLLRLRHLQQQRPRVGYFFEHDGQFDWR